MLTPTSPIHIIREIGRGAEGIVYEGLFNGKRCALKRISISKGIQELNILKILKNEHITNQIGSHIETGDMVMYISLELLGPSLSSLGKISENDASKYLYPILQAIQHIHSMNYCHFDIKPSNCLLTLDHPPSCKLGDFGLARSLECNTSENSNDFAGTPHFLSPEVASLGVSTNERDLTTASDIWSFAATLLSCVTGKLPIQSPPLVAAFKLANDLHPIDVRNLLDISNNLKNMLLLCFNRDPSRRPTANELLHHPWFNEDIIIISEDFQLMLPQATTTAAESSTSSTSPNFSFSSSSHSVLIDGIHDSHLFEQDHLGQENQENISSVDILQDSLDNINTSAITIQELERRLEFLLLENSKDIVDNIDEI
jgi:serine/threonine protein kinase